MFGKKDKTKKVKKKSLSKTLQHLVVRVALLILVASTIMNWISTSTELTAAITLSGGNLVNGMKALISLDESFEDYASDVMDTYRSIPEEIRQNPDSQEYRSYFARFAEDPRVEYLSNLLLRLNSSMRLEDMYIVGLDTEHKVLVYILDPNESPLYVPHPVGDQRIPEKDAESEFSEDPEELGVFEGHSSEYGKYLTVTGTIPGKDGNAVAYVMCDIPELISSISSVLFVLVYFVVLALAILIIVCVTRLRMRKRIIKPIKVISGAVEKYTNERKEGNASTSCFKDLPVHTGDELEDLSVTLGQMEHDIVVYEDDLREATSRQERMNTELSVATGIQAHMLPDSKTAFPDRSEFTIYSSMTPAREVGGDFYDFFMIDDHHLGIVIADVSGKGIPAALFMMSSMIIINNFASLGFSPGEVLRLSNEKICKSNVLDMFVTVWFGILDVRTGQVTASNAGHEYPAVCGADGSFALIHDKHGFVIGGMEGVRYKEYSFTLEKDGILFLYTDGVPEATNADEEMYGTDRMLEALNAANAAKDKTPEELGKALREDVDRFVNGAPQFDDLTMLCLKYNGQ